jgi:hypothetical protein
MTSIRTLSVVAALALGASPVAAQGIMAGWVNAGISLEEDGQEVETGTRNGFTAGLVFGKASGLIGFRSEALYTQKGFTLGNDELKSAYIDVPIMLAVDAMIVRAYAGPQLSFLVSCNATSGGFEESCTDEVETFDFGFKGGVGAKLAMFTIDLVGTIGTKNASAVDKDTINAKNQTLSVVLGLSMP